MKVELIPVGLLARRDHMWLNKFPTVLGRATDADVRVEDRWASRFHCEIDEDDGILVLRDLESSNGTLVNGAAVRSSPLLPGDQFTVGISVFEVSYERPVTEVPAAASRATWDLESDLGP